VVARSLVKLCQSVIIFLPALVNLTMKENVLMQVTNQSTRVQISKKVYCKPRLQEWGSLTFLTRDAGESQPILDDSKCGSMEVENWTKKCD
jgi:hypothetical protein